MEGLKIMKMLLTVLSATQLVLFMMTPLIIDNLILFNNLPHLIAVFFSGKIIGNILQKWMRSMSGLSNAIGFMIGGYLIATFLVFDGMINDFLSLSLINYVLFPIFYGSLLCLIVIVLEEARTRIDIQKIIRVCVCSVILSYATVFFFVATNIAIDSSASQILNPLVMSALFTIINYFFINSLLNATFLTRIAVIFASSYLSFLISFSLLITNNTLIMPLINALLFTILLSALTKILKVNNSDAKPLPANAANKFINLRNGLKFTGKILSTGYMILFLIFNWSVIRLVDLDALDVSSTPLLAASTPADRYPMVTSTLMRAINGFFDLRNVDGTGADWSDDLDSLLMASFSSRTVWPERLPGDFSYEVIMKLGKNPGLGVRQLHEMGITGKGVGIAIIDQSLLAEHVEISNNLKVYEQFIAPLRTSTHAEAHSFVASMAVGENTGVAPSASLFYLSSTVGYFTIPRFYLNNHNYLSAGIHRVLEMNKHLPYNERIRVISISMGFDMLEVGASALRRVINRANEAGVFVITATPQRNFDFRLRGLGRDPMSDPDDILSYTVGSWWGESFFRDYNDPHSFFTNMLLVPMDSRTGANWNGETYYTFYRNGGLSWSVPWLAGLYALGAQVYASITPELFVELAFETGDTIQIERDGVNYTLETIVNPVRLITALKNRL